MVTPNRVDVNEACEAIERITTRIMGVLPDQMFTVNTDITRDQAEQLDLMVSLLRDCTKVLKDAAKANWLDELDGLREQYGWGWRFQQRQSRLKSRGMREAFLASAEMHDTTDEFPTAFIPHDDSV